MNNLAVEDHQFAGHGFTDHAAICMTCGRHHLISQGEEIEAQKWLDWLAKHPAPKHYTMIVPYSEIKNLDALRDNADVKPTYGASAAYSITLASLGTSSTLIAGRESDGVSNASNKYVDELVAGFITTGTSPTDAKAIEVHAVGATNDTPTYPDVFDGTNSAETITAAGVKYPICRAIALIQTNSTSDVIYPFGPTGIRQLFGDALPPAHVIFVTHNTAVNLNSTGGNHAIYHTPVYFTVA